MRILVTGSRDFEREPVYFGLNLLCMEFDLNFPSDEHDNTMPDPSKITIVHGACPTGADFWADQWCISNNFVAETHPANWQKYKKRAGFVRNEEMVNLGADLCIAFLNPCTKTGCKEPKPHDSHGGAMTARLAETAGIEVRKVRPA